MLDTIKVGIPLNEKQHRIISKKVEGEDGYQWVQLNSVTGDLRYLRVKGLAQTDQNSFHRDIRFDTSSDYRAGETQLTLEFSAPKLWYGHNISLLYDFSKALELLRESLHKQLGLSRVKLPDIETWHVLRVDACYNWQFPSQTTCHSYLDSLKTLHFPRKHPIIYPTSISFAGVTYSFKFYEKLPEFLKHDQKELLKSKASLEWIEHLEEKADGVLRCEATLRRKYLQRKGLLTVKDILTPITYMTLDSNLAAIATTENEKRLVMAFLLDAYRSNRSDMPLKDGLRIEFPAQTMRLSDRAKLVTGIPLEVTHEYEHPGGGITFSQVDPLTEILQTMLTKFLGNNVVMQTSDKVKAKLMEHFKPVKAARLVAFWLYVQKFGSADAKAIYGDNSYYVSKRELKLAGVSLLEPNEKVVAIDKDFVARFRLQVPSEHVTNKFDEFRDGDNLLNFVPRHARPAKQNQGDLLGG